MGQVSRPCDGLFVAAVVVLVLEILCGGLRQGLKNYQLVTYCKELSQSSSGIQEPRSDQINLNSLLHVKYPRYLNVIIQRQTFASHKIVFSFTFL